MKLKPFYISVLLAAVICVGIYKTEEAHGNDNVRLSEQELRKKIEVALAGEGIESRKAADALADYYSGVTLDLLASAAWRLRAIELGSKLSAQYYEKKIHPFETGSVEGDQYLVQPAPTSKVRFAIPNSVMEK